MSDCLDCNEYIRKGISRNASYLSVKKYIVSIAQCLFCF